CFICGNINLYFYSLQKVAENCCRCNRPKFTEPADCCSCQCHIAVQKRFKKCCVCRKQINTIYSSDDKQSERLSSSEKSVVSSDSQSNFQMILYWIFQTGSGVTQNTSDENPSDLSSPEESRMSSAYSNEPEQASPEESPSASQWGLHTLTSWIFQPASEETLSNPSVGNLLMEASPEETSSCSSFDDLSDSCKVTFEESLRSPPTSSWWNFHMILYWMHQAESANAQRRDDRDLPYTPEKILNI
ncbi:unnamed protein product, partial [Larinioides sclopetarius]